MPQATEPATDGSVGILDAVALGVLHGPTELLPVSSSGHTTLVPWLAGMRYAGLPPSRRKTIEVALHAGTALALVVAPPRSGIAMPRPSRRVLLAALTLAPTALAGLAVRGPVRHRLGTPGTVAAGLAAGSAVMLVADRERGPRAAGSVGPVDALAAGVAQSLALWPGVSRSAMSIAAFRMRGFAPGDSARLAREGIVPVSLAAAVLEGSEAAREGTLAADAPAAAAAAIAAFASTLVSRPLVRRLERGASLAPLAAVRLVTAAATARRIRSLGDDGRR